MDPLKFFVSSSAGNLYFIPESEVTTKMAQGVARLSKDDAKTLVDLTSKEVRTALEMTMLLINASLKESPLLLKILQKHLVLASEDVNKETYEFRRCAGEPARYAQWMGRIVGKPPAQEPPQG